MLHRPANKQELFNLRHSSARNVIERIFGVLKRRFQILLLAPEYNLHTQARLPTALCALHNFIRRYDPDEGDLPGSGQGQGAQEHGNGIGQDGMNVDEELGGDDEHENQTMATLRDRIASEMWNDYQDVLQQRMMDDDDDDWEDSEEEEAEM